MSPNIAGHSSNVWETFYTPKSQIGNRLHCFKSHNCHHTMLRWRFHFKALISCTLGNYYASVFRGDADRLSEGAFVWRGSGCSRSMGVANWSGFCSQRHQSAQPEYHSCMCAALVLWFQAEPMNAASAKQGAAWAVVGVDCYFIFANASSLWILTSFYFLATLLSSNTTWCKYSASFSLRFNLLIHICLSAHINFI